MYPKNHYGDEGLVYCSELLVNAMVFVGLGHSNVMLKQQSDVFIIILLKRSRVFFTGTIEKSEA